MTELRFDDTGRYIMREVQPYMMDYSDPSQRKEDPRHASVKCDYCKTAQFFQDIWEDDDG